MRIRVLHLEDDILKHTAIARVIRNCANAEIDLVKDVESGIEKFHFILIASKLAELYEEIV